MHVRNSIPRRVFRPTPVPSERGFAVMVAVVAVVLLGLSLWLSRRGVPVIPCGDLAAVCVQHTER